MNETFAAIAEFYNETTDVRDALKDATRSLATEIRTLKVRWQDIHSFEFNEERLKQLVNETDFAKFHESLSACNTAIAPGEFYKYWNRFSSHFQNISFLFHLRSYFQNKTLGDWDQIKKELNFDKYENLDFSLDEFLIGICYLAEELSRYATNCVTRRSFAEPKEILTFLNRIYAGMSTLNLKNSELRRKYDSIKYKIKDVEAVVYDLTLRGLGAEA